MEFRGFSRNFESIEPSPGFAQLIGEDWKSSHNQDQVRKKLSNDKCLEVNVAILQKNLNCPIFDKKNDKKQNDQKS